MANRTVNVNIRYNVNTLEVQKAQAASVAAQRATDSLRKATEDYGKAAAHANKQASDAIKATQKETKSLASGFNDLYGSVKTVFQASIVAEVVNMTLSMAKLSGQVEGVSKAFNRLPNATLLLEDLRRSTHGTVTDLELMQKTLMASNYKIPLQNLGKLLEFAATKAQQTGQEVNHLVDYIVTGIGLRSVRRLDDLGFTASRLKDALGGVSVQAASMGQLVNAVTTLMGEDLNKLGGYAETSATKVERISRKWEDLKLIVSQALTSPAVLNFYEKALDAISNGADVVLNGQAAVIEKQAKAQAIKNVENFKEMQLTKDILKNRQATLDAIQQEINTTVQNIGRNNDELNKLKARFLELTSRRRYEDRDEIDRIKEQNKFYNFKNVQLKESIRLLKDYMTSLNEVTEEEKPKGEGDNRRGFLDKPLTQTVDLRFKDPKTGAITKENNDKVIKQFLDNAQKIIDDLTLHKSIYAVKIPVTPFLPMDFQDKLEAEFNHRREEIIGLGFEIATDQLKSIEEAEVESYRTRLDNLRSYYDEQVMLAGDNERLKNEIKIKAKRDEDKLQMEIAMREWKARKNAIILDTAAGIMRAFATAVSPEKALIQAGLVAAFGASQLLIANRNKPQGFKKGVLDLKGPGTETSDSIPAMLSKGESVMTAEETRRSMGILKAIRLNKLDDRILKSIDFSGGKSVNFDDTKIVKAIQSQVYPKAPDIVRQATIVYEVHTDRNGNKKKIRSKSMG